MREIYWIDDNINNMSHYIQGVIKELWGNENEKGISSVIRIFGDGYKQSDKEGDWKKEDIESLMEEIENNMAEHYMNMVAWNWGRDITIYNEKLKLINKKPKVVDMTDDKIRNLISSWKTLKNHKWIKGEFGINDILEYFDIPDGASVAIDLVLLKDDIKRVYDDIPILSMFLYDELSSNGHKCVLYSTFLYDSLFIDKWKEIYNKNKNKEDIIVDTIYSGRLMWDKVENSSIVLKLKEIAKEENEGGKGLKNE